ncbi:aminoglycoside phosphotransferase family protein [Nocardiopsis sp. YSL2]|uniref:aminoglycoside phosphotransferase family protein n=1 Tax=Nocardiopsis sp. YSL2 TaxID=2939492 RepID=UPI0026F47B01|nr:aminoglycoside phosphotransferase family protein [Nocardiopsis sp. YSL2]
MTTRFHTHHIDIRENTVVKRYIDWSRGEPYREWAALKVLDFHVPDLAPHPIHADLDATPPAITMSRLPGRVLRGEPTTSAQIEATAHALDRLHRIPTRAVTELDPASWGPEAAVAKVRRLIHARPDPGSDPLARQAHQEGTTWMATTDPDHLLDNPYPPVLGLADGNHANFLWDGQRGCVRLIDWEDSGRNDRAFELGELTEHISRTDGTLDPEALLAQIDLTPREAMRVRGFRRLVALCWLLQLGPTGAATPHNPPGTARRVAERLLNLFG